MCVLTWFCFFALLLVRIPDDEAVKPDDWDEDAPANIPDISKVKPEGWMDDGPEYILDPDAAMPDDWYLPCLSTML